MVICAWRNFTCRTPAFAGVSKKAAVWRPCPFVIILKDKAEEKYKERSTLRIDPGASKTGLSLLNPKGCVPCFIELDHHFQTVRKKLDIKTGARQNRRQRETCYSKPKWRNRILEQWKDHLQKKVDSKQSSGSLSMKTRSKTVDGIRWNSCAMIQKADGYSYASKPVNNSRLSHQAVCQ